MAPHGAIFYGLALKHASEYISLYFYEPHQIGCWSAFMASPQAHYEHLLAYHYTWMFGVPFMEKVEEQASLLQELVANPNGLAVDLGCGSGFQALALADMGAKRVHAIDTSSLLLSELRKRAEGVPICAHEMDLMSFEDVLEHSPDTVVCMGDTLTHLACLQDVTSLLHKIGSSLQSGGRLVLSWRDLSSPPEGLNRFIPLRATDDKLMTCFLEDHDDTVMVHDLVYTREKEAWRLNKSAYPKLKISSAWVVDQLAPAGLVLVDERSVKGMSVITARPARKKTLS